VVNQNFLESSRKGGNIRPPISRLGHNPDLGSRSDRSERNFPVENATCHVPLGLRLWRDPLRERLRLPNKKSNYDTVCSSGDSRILESSRKGGKRVKNKEGELVCG